MNDHEIRLMLLNPQNSSRIKELIPSKSDRTILSAMNVFNHLSSAEYSQWVGIKVAHASQLLKNCFDKGYLTRVKVTSKTGGEEFIYTARY